MKSTKVLYTGFAILTAMLGSCEDFLTRTPPLETTIQDALNTYEGLVSATNAAYAPLYSSEWYGRGFVVICDLKGGNGKASPINTGRFRYDYTWTNNDSYTSNVWAPAYQTITRACNVLEYIEKLDDPLVDAADLNQLKGECLFLRALGHFDLVRMYAQSFTSQPQSLGVPIITKTEISYPERSSVEAVFNQIVSDLENSISMLGENPRSDGTNGSSRAYASKYAAIALMAKVSLYMGKWQDASDYATDVINGDFILYNASNYADIWGQNGQSEVVFEVFGKDGQEYYPGFDEIGYIFYPYGYGDICATNNLLGLYEANDVRLTVFMGHPDYPGFTWPAKYPGKNHIRENNIPILRLSEMYLIRAEAALNHSTGQNALEDYNMIRTNRGLEPAVSVSLYDIYDERRRELCFEGNQLWDLSRTGRGLERDPEEILISESDNINIAFPDYRWAMPIPARETDANKNLEPNPGY
ncbi:MAG: RagB/SusD family nutrient uptake outer membrane protein [Bacteroidales bacterium]|nr:RagB/SusD family nutrient uptake outer membrane protein [Bacteroidales bacterium]